jgi:lipoprotein-releasing system permease protein
VPFELFVALRYLKEGRLQTWLILTGVGVGVGAIIFVSALINGLQKSLVDRTLGSQAHVVVRPPEELPRVLERPDSALRATVVQRPPQRVRSIVEWQRVQGVVRRIPGVVAVAPTVAGPAMAVRGLGATAVTVRGIDIASYERIVDLEGKVVDGAFDLTGFNAVVGTELARTLGLEVGSRVRIQAAGDRGGVYTVSGIFDLGSKDLNERWIFVSLRGAQTMFNLEGGVSTLEVKGTDIFQAENLAAHIQDRTGLRAESWMTRNSDLLVGLRSQSQSSVMIQVFVILAVALGIASVLAVSVVQKSREIGILKATGTRTASVTRIFLFQGAILGTAGSLLGIAVGTVLALFFASLATNPDGSPRFPVDLNLVLFGRSVAVALMVGLLSAILPARRAARMDPATVIRNG